MRKLAVLSLAGLLFQFAVAQDAESKVDAIKQTVEEKKGADRFVVDLHFDNWIHDIADLDVEWFSRGANFYLVYDVPFGKSKLSFSIGAGIGNSNIYHNSVINYHDTTNIAFFENWDSTYTSPSKKNKISTTFLEVPLEFRFRSKPSKPSKSVKFGLGFKGGYLIDSHNKIKFKEDGTRKIFKEKGIANLNRWRYGPTFRLGYGPVSVFGFYNLGTFFKTDEGPVINSFGAGITINAL